MIIVGIDIIVRVVEHVVSGSARAPALERLVVGHAIQLVTVIRGVVDASEIQDSGKPVRHVEEVGVVGARGFGEDGWGVHEGIHMGPPFV